MIRKGIIVTRDGARFLGGPGSGNFGHAGIPGQRGGSRGGGGGTLKGSGNVNTAVFEDIESRSWDDSNSVVEPVIKEIARSGIGGTVGDDLTYGGGYDTIFESDVSEYIQETFSEMVAFNQTDIYNLTESEMGAKIDSAAEYLQKETLGKINKIIGEIEKDIQNIDPDLSEENKAKAIKYLKQSKSNMEKKAAETTEKVIKIKSDYKQKIADEFNKL